MPKIIRLLGIVLTLQAHPWRQAHMLATLFEVSKRTIYRDIDVLCSAGVPIVSVPGKGYRLYEGYFLPPLSFTTQEATLLLLGASFVQKRMDPEAQRQAAEAQKKIEAVLPERVRAQVDALRERFQFPLIAPLHPVKEQAALGPLREAVVRQHAVRFTYVRPGHDTAATVTERIVDPYGLVYLSGKWLLVGYCHLRQSVRRFALYRIANLCALRQSFERPADFTLQRDMQLENRTQTVRLLVQEAVASDLLAQPSASAAFFTEGMQATEDGVHLTLKVRALTDVLPWILQWGQHVEVLAPPALRAALVEAAEAIAARHRP